MHSYLILLVLIGCIHSQNMRTTFSLTSKGMQFLPADLVQLLGTVTSSSLTKCAFTCIMFPVQCRTFQFDSSTLQCRIFEGDLTTGQIIPSTSSSTSIVGMVELTLDMFVNYGQSCSKCSYNRFLICTNATCQCHTHSYFDGFMCKLQQFTGAQCSSSDACRADLSLTCLPFFQCGPPSVLLGLTIAGYGNGLEGSDAIGLFSPSGICVMPTGEFYVADRNNARVQHFMPGSSVGQTVAGDMTTGSGPTQLNEPFSIDVNPSTRSVYVADFYNNRIQLWVANATQGKTIIGVSTWPVTQHIFGVRLDAQGQIYVSDFGSSIVIRWPPNGTNGTVVAGIGTGGSDNKSLSNPMQIDLDASGEHIYIVDYSNNRIQKWKLPINGSAPATAGVTVAGGNGAGPGATQLNGPYAVYVSKKTGSIYIADAYNNRIQRWDVGATQGVTVAGGSLGIGAAQLNQPAGVALDPNETYLYVSDQANHRIQRFNLI